MCVCVRGVYGYRLMDMNTTLRVQIPDEAVCITHRANTLGKSMTPTILLLPWPGNQSRRRKTNRDIDPAVRVFANGPGDLGSIPGRVIPKTLKMVLDTTLLNTQHYKVQFKGKVEQSRNGVAPSPTPWCSSYRKGAFGSPSTMVVNFTFLL